MASRARGFRKESPSVSFDSNDMKTKRPKAVKYIVPFQLFAATLGLYMLVRYSQWKPYTPKNVSSFINFNLRGRGAEVYESDKSVNDEERRRKFDPSSHSEDQKKVVDMAKWAWKGYSTYAYGHDSLDVLKLEGTGLPNHDMALTLVDSMDTLFVMGMFEEFDKASQWMQENMLDRIFKKGFISFFETTIRVLGGLLSAYNLSGKPHLLKLADELGEALYPAFQQYKHGVPAKDFDIISNRTRGMSTLAEAGTLQLEFKYLARLTGKKKYYDCVEHIMDLFNQDVEEKYTDGLLPVEVSSSTGRIVDSKITLGAMGDSYYEYLLKQWLLSGKKDTKYKERYLRAVNGIKSKLVAKSKPNGLAFIGELLPFNKFSPKMDHLVCYVPGMLALGYLHGMPQKHLELAEELVETCFQMYDRMQAKLAPEIVYFNMDDKSGKPDLYASDRDAFNLLRPETVESLMILHRVTKKPKYRAYGRAIIEAFERECKLPEKGGYTSIGNVYKGPAKKRFRREMESFFIAETLKYLFLLFSDDDVLPLDEIVFNTEAHPFEMDMSD